MNSSDQLTPSWIDQKDFPNQKEFIAQFKFPFLSYDNPVEFTDGNFGFSVIKDCENGYASLIRIFSPKDNLQAKKEVLPLIATATDLSQLG